jgi:hypothetical protein
VNPGPVEEAGQTARGIIDALRQQPMTLGLLVVNVLFMVLVFINVRENQHRADDMVRELAHLVAACPAPLVPNPSTK